MPVKRVAIYQNCLMELFLQPQLNKLEMNSLQLTYPTVLISPVRLKSNGMNFKLFFISDLLNLKYQWPISIQWLTFTNCNDCIVLWPHEIQVHYLFAYASHDIGSVQCLTITWQYPHWNLIQCFKVLAFWDWFLCKKFCGNS